MPYPHWTISIRSLHCCSEPWLREDKSSPPAYLVDVGQRALTGELHRVHLHSRACLGDLIVIAQWSHKEHEGLRGANELIVHLGRERAATETDKLLRFHFYL